MEIKNKIENLINDNEVCLFMKGTPQAPQCGFSMAVVNILKHLNVNFIGINVLEDENLRQGIKTFSDWPTIPQLYIKKEFIGGCDIIRELFENGELKKLLLSKKLLNEELSYKVLIASLAIILVYNFTIGKEIKDINKKINYFSNSEGRKKLINSIKKEMKKLMKKKII